MELERGAVSTDFLFVAFSEDLGYLREYRTNIIGVYEYCKYFYENILSKNHICVFFQTSVLIYINVS